MGMVILFALIIIRKCFTGKMISLWQNKYVPFQEVCYIFIHSLATGYRPCWVRMIYLWMIEAFCCEMESMRIYQIADVLEWKQRPFHKLAKRLILTVIMIKYIVEALWYTSQHIKNIKIFNGISIRKCLVSNTSNHNLTVCNSMCVLNGKLSIFHLSQKCNGAKTMSKYVCQNNSF